MTVDQYQRSYAMYKPSEVSGIRPTVIVGDTTVFQFIAKRTRCLHSPVNLVIRVYSTPLDLSNRVKYLNVGPQIVMICKLLLTIIFIALVFGIIALLRTTFNPREREQMQFDYPAFKAGIIPANKACRWTYRHGQQERPIAKT